MQEHTKSESYRVYLAVPVFGGIGLVLWLYVVLYAAGVIDWALFSKVDDFRAHIGNRGAVVYFSLMLGMCIAVLFSARIQVKVTSDGVVYRGCFRTVRLLWRDVIRLTYSPRGVDICLWTTRDYIRFGQYIARGRRLLNTVQERVRANAPEAQIAQAQPRFLPQKRKRDRHAR